MKLSAIFLWWWLLTLVHCRRDQDYEDEAYKPPDMSGWVDPTDMIHYDPATKTMKNVPTPEKETPTVDAACQTDEQVASLTSFYEQCQTELGQLQNAVESLNVTLSTQRKQLDRCSVLHKELFFKQYIRSVLEKFKYLANEVNDVEDGHYDVEIKFTSAEFKYLLEYANQEHGSLQEVHTVLSKMFQRPRWSTVMSEISEYGEFWQQFKEYLAITTQVVSVVALMLWICRHVQLSPKWILVNLTLGCFIVSVPWNWWHLYKKEIAKHRATLLKTMPDSCLPGRQSFLTFLASQMSLGTDECTAYFEPMEVDPWVEVTPAKAVAVTFIKFFLEPAGHIGEAINRLLVSSFTNLPIYLWVPAYFIMFALLILATMVVGRYRIRTLLFSIEPHHPTEPLTSRIRELEEENRRLTGEAERRQLELQNEVDERQAALEDYQNRVDDLNRLCELQRAELLPLPAPSTSRHDEGDGPRQLKWEVGASGDGPSTQCVAEPEDESEVRQPVQVSEAHATVGLAVVTDAETVHPLDVGAGELSQSAEAVPAGSTVDINSFEMIN